ncbi:MAG: guanylate kinase [Eubacteriales bacterium]|nr:guanylate kinase [Eubacteriales bacterium]
MTQKRRGMLIIISGPSGTGKGTLCERLIKLDGHIAFSVSATTRPAREGEVDGVHYHFLTEAAFDELLQSGAFLEHASVHDHRYGTLRKPVEDALEAGQDILLDVDSQGAASVMKSLPEAVSVFILPPSYQALEQRLHTRNTDDAKEIEKRLFNARAEMRRCKNYCYALINDDLDIALSCLQCIITAERHRTLRYLPEIAEEMHQAHG